MAAAAKAVAFFAAITSLLLVPASYGRREVAGEGLVFIIHCEDCVGAITAALPCVLAINCTPVVESDGKCSRRLTW